MSTDQLQNSTIESLHQVAYKLQYIIDTRHSSAEDDKDCSRHNTHSGVSTISDPSRTSSPPPKRTHRLDEDNVSSFTKRPNIQYDEDTPTQVLTPVFSAKSEDYEIDIGAFSPDPLSPPSEQEHVDVNSSIVLEMPFILFQRLLDQCSNIGILNAIKSLPAVPDEVNDACVQRIVDLMPDEEYGYESHTPSEPLGYSSESDTNSI